MKRIRTLKDILLLAKKDAGRKKLVLVGADNCEGLKSLSEAMQHGLVQPVLVGDKDSIIKTARSAKFALRGIEVIDHPNPTEAAAVGVAMCRSGEVDILMKGSVGTDVVLRAILDRERGLGRGGLLSNVTVFESPTEKRLLFMTDPAVNINPDLARKVEMLRNAVLVAHQLGFETVKAAVLTAVEKINPKDMPATADAAV
ncbi:MAG: hypothetical protein JW818_18305, partial [Pirellulales bacterium]|nr:hypothetical protein [Pirellulales bacterium]